MSDTSLASIPENAATVSPADASAIRQAMGGVMQASADPAKVQAEAAFRVLIIVVGTALTTMGITKYAGILTILASNSGNIVAALGALGALGAFVYGQFRTRLNAKQAAVMAHILPPSIAQTK